MDSASAEQSAHTGVPHRPLEGEDEAYRAACRGRTERSRFLGPPPRARWIIRTVALGLAHVQPLYGLAGRLPRPAPRRYSGVT